MKLSFQQRALCVGMTEDDMIQTQENISSINILWQLEWLLNSSQRLMDYPPNFAVYSGKACVLIKWTISALNQAFIGNA